MKDKLTEHPDPDTANQHADDSTASRGRPSIMVVAFLVTMAWLVLDSAWLFGHYVYPHSPPRSQRTIHLIVFLSIPILGIVVPCFLSPRRVRNYIGHWGYRAAWAAWDVCGIVGVPLWMFSWVG